MLAHLYGQVSERSIRDVDGRLVEVECGACWSPMALTEVERGRFGQFAAPVTCGACGAKMRKFWVML